MKVQAKFLGGTVTPFFPHAGCYRTKGVRMSKQQTVFGSGGLRSYLWVVTFWMPTFITLLGHSITLGIVELRSVRRAGAACATARRLPPRV